MQILHWSISKLELDFQLLLGLPSSKYEVYEILLLLLFLLFVIVSSICMTLESKKVAPAMETMIAAKQRRSTTRGQHSSSLYG